MRKLFTDKKIKPAMQPKVDFEGKPLDGNDVKFTVNIEVMPEIKVEDFSKLKFDRLVADVEAGDINKALEDIASNQKSYTPLKKKRKSKIGDSVLIDFKGRFGVANYLKNIHLRKEKPSLLFLSYK